MNMDIKTKIEDFFINIALGPVLAKRERVFGNREKEMNRCIKAFFSAIKGSDTDRIKALFAQNAINEIGDEELESMINNFLSNFSGEFVDSTKLLVNSEGTVDHGKKSDVLMGSMEITSTSAEYKMAIKMIPYDDFNADNIGIWSINIMQKDTVSEYNYTGDGQYRTGIYFDVPRPLR